MSTKFLDDLLTNPKIPTLPAVALRVLEKVGSPDCTLDAVGEIIRQDPALCGLILKTLNSALYSFSRPVTSVDKALVMLGLTRIRSLILTLYLPAIRRSCPPSPLLSDFWKASVIGAIITREISAQSSRRDPESDLLAALMRDLGRVVLMQGVPEKYTAILEAARGKSEAETCALEMIGLGLTHADVSAELLRRWRLPDAMTKAIAWHHRPEMAVGSDADTVARTLILHFASLATDFLTHPLLPGLRGQLIQSAEQNFGLDEERLAAFLEPLNEKVRSMAGFLDVDLGPDENFAEILANASQELVRLAMESSMESLREQETKKEAEAEAAVWREKATRLQEQTTRDALTGLHNRPHVIESLTRALARARRTHSAVGLLFIDLDGFKPVNDRFGHAAGDTVLKEVAAQLRTNVRDADVVARFGGDEFCILLPDTTEDGVRIVGERVVRVLNDLPLEFSGQKCKIGASVGTAFTVPWAAPSTAAALMDAADRAMYDAKRAGKNRVSPAIVLTKAHRDAIAAVGLRSFRTFLVRRHQTTARKIQIADDRRAPRPCLQRIARRLGWLNRDEAVRLTRFQRGTGKTFEEAAVEASRLKPAHLEVLIAIQLDPPEFLAKRLVQGGVLSDAEAASELKAYYEAIGVRRPATATAMAR